MTPDPGLLPLYEYLLVAAGLLFVMVLLREIFAGAPGGDEKPLSWRGALAMAAVALALLALGAWLRREETGWWFVAAFFGALFALGLVYGLLPGPAERFVTLGFPLLFALGVAVWLLNDSVERERGRIDGERRALEQAKQEEEKFLAAIRQARTFWSAGPGVQEFAAGARVLGWLALDPKLEVDWEYEREQGARAKRVLPIRVVLLNNSYADAALPATPGGSVWRLEVRDAAGRALAAWPLDVGFGEASLGPVERREFQVPWDGRGDGGELAAPGRYVATLLVPAAAPVTAAVDIEDAGPIRTRIPSDLERQLASQQETVRMIGENIRMQQNLSNAINNLNQLRR